MMKHYGCLMTLVMLTFCLLVPLSAQTNLLTNGDFETQEVNFWSMLNNGLGGAQVIWATDEAANSPWGINQKSLRSLKVVKGSATADMVGWLSVNNADLYWNNAGGGDLYNLTFAAKTSGVNTSPATEDAKIGVWYKYYAGGNLISEQFVEVDQTAADKDWTNYVGAVTVSTEPDSVIAVAVMGKDATGTVWFDNVDCNTNSGWTMGMFGGDAETPLGWMFWKESGHWNFCDMITDEGAHSGSNDILLYEADNNSDEMVYYSEPVPAKPDTWYKLGVWVQTDSVDTNSQWIASNAVPNYVNNRVNVCFFFHKAPIYGNWDLTGGDQFFYIDQRDVQKGWTHYTVVALAPSDAAGLSVRARLNSFTTGYAWYDDFTIEEITLIATSIEDQPTPIAIISTDFQLANNYPNPFNPQTIIEFKVPQTGQVVLSVYNSLGQKIRTLVNETRPAGIYQVLWNGRDDYGNVVASGIYLYQLRGENALITKKMTFIK
jgi:hypothetical protein